MAHSTVGYASSETHSVLSAGRRQVFNRKHGMASLLKTAFTVFLFSLFFSVALSLNHQQKIKIIIVMNSLTGLCNSGWIYGCLYNKSTVVWGNPAVSLGADDYENHVGIRASVFSVS